jgi:hypothetical protein
MYDTDENGIIPTTSNLYKKGLDIDRCFDLPLPTKKSINLINTTATLQDGWDVLFNITGTKVFNDIEGNKVLS